MMNYIPFQIKDQTELIIFPGCTMFVCLSVGTWRADGNLNPCTDLDEILHAHLHLPKKRFW